MAHCTVTVNSESVDKAIKKVDRLISLLTKAKNELDEYESPFKDFIYVYGNYGGDFLKIMNNEDGTIKLSSGHCCVVDIEKTVPVEFITAIINEKMMEYNGDPLAVIDSFNLSDEFKKELKAKVK